MCVATSCRCSERRKLAGSRRIAAAEDDVALIDVAGERAFDVVGGMIDVSDFDGGT